MASQKIFFNRLVCLFMLVFLTTTSGLYGSANVSMQTKDKWIRVEIPKYTDGSLHALIDELNGYDQKVSDVFFNYETRELTVYYTNNVTYDDILQVIYSYYTDFNKVGGTEL